MKRLLLILAIATALAGCGTAETPAQPAADTPIADTAAADSAALLARPTLTPPPPKATSTPFPTEPPTSAVPPTSVPPTLEPVPATAEPPTAEPIQDADADPSAWITYQNDEYGFSVSYPPCLGEVFEEPPFSRPAGLYTEGHNHKLSRTITTTFNLGSGPVGPNCAAKSMNIMVWDLEGYSHYNIYSELIYDPASDTWFSNSGSETVPADSDLVDGEGWQGKRFGFGDAQIVITGLAVPYEERNLVLEISFGYFYSQDGPPEPGIDSATVDRILQTLRFTP